MTTQQQRGRKHDLMGSLVALSLTVEEKEECVLSSNRKDNAAFAVSEPDNDFRPNRHLATRLLLNWGSSPSGLRLSFSRYLFGIVR